MNTYEKLSKHNKIGFWIGVFNFIFGAGMFYYSCFFLNVRDMLFSSINIIIGLWILLLVYLSKEE